LILLGRPLAGACAMISTILPTLMSLIIATALLRTIPAIQ